MKNTIPTIQAGKQFAVSVEKLYDAWTKEDNLKQWWQPAGNKLVTVENELKEGGAISYEFETPHGNKSFTITGEYEEVEPAAKLVYTWNWKMPGNADKKEDHYELTVLFAGEGNGSRISITQVDLDNQEAVHPHQKGWEEELERLAQFLS